MAGGTFDHSQITTDLVVTLRALLSRKVWAPAIVTGRDAVIDVPALGISMALGEIYGSIG